MSAALAGDRRDIACQQAGIGREERGSRIRQRRVITVLHFAREILIVQLELRF